MGALCRTDIDRSLPPPLLFVTAFGRTTYLFQCDEGRPWPTNSSRTYHDTMSNATSHPEIIKPPPFLHMPSHAAIPLPPAVHAPLRAGHPTLPVSSPQNGTRPINSRVPRKRARKNIMDVEARRLHIEADEWASEVTPTSVRCRGCKKIIRLDGRSLYYRGLWDKHRNICREIHRMKRGLAAKPLERVGAQKDGHGKVDIWEQGFKTTTTDGITVATKPLLPVLPNFERKPYSWLSGPGIPPIHHYERGLLYWPTAISGFPCDHDGTHWGSATPLHQVTLRSAQERSTNAFKSEDTDMYTAMSRKSSTTEFDLLQAAQCLIALKLQR